MNNIGIIKEWHSIIHVDTFLSSGKHKLQKLQSTNSKIFALSFLKFILSTQSL